MGEAGMQAEGLVTTAERISPTVFRVKRRFAAPPEMVFKAWTVPALVMRWWMPKSVGATFISCEIDARTGGCYKFVFGHPNFDQPMAFFGRYLEVIPGAKLVWTNEEGGGEGPITTVTFTAVGGQTLVVVDNVHPSEASLDAEIESGATSGSDESHAQLDALLAEGF